MAYSPDVVSLAKMLHRDNFPLEHLKPHVESLYEQLCVLHPTLRKFAMRREVASEAEKTIKSFISSQNDGPTSESKSSTSAFLQIFHKITITTVPMIITGHESRTKKKIIVGQEEDFKKLKEEIVREKSNEQREVLPIIGLPGSGKTTLARSLYKDSSIIDEFEIHDWVTFTHEYQVEEIFSKLFHSLETKGQKAGEGAARTTGKCEKLKDVVYQSLLKKKYLIVVDDMWDEDVWDKVKHSFPDERNGSRIILTTRSNEIARYAKTSDSLHEMQPLSLYHSWELLTLTVFEEGGSCPPHLKDIGWEISKNCRGLPLSMMVIGGLLSHENMTEEYWKNFQGDTLDAAAKGEEAYLEILFLSYNHLPGRLKGLRVAEGFLKPSPVKIVEQVTNDYLEQLIDRNLLYVRNATSNNIPKACGMHDTLRDLSVKECGNEKFFHSIRRYVQTLEQVKEVTFARTLLYVGAHHHHPLPLYAVTVYFIDFPNQILKIIHLRFFSLTYNGNLPSKLSNLEKLQILSARRHPKIIFLGVEILLDEIWSLTQLRHLLFTKSDLPKIPILKSTIPLAASCTKEVLENMPKLTKLAMWIESPGPVDIHLDQVKKLESFKFIFLNPIPKKKLREIAFEGEEWYPKRREFRKLKFLLLEYLDLVWWEADHTHFPKLQRLIMSHCYELEKIPEDYEYLGNLELMELVDCSPGAVESAEPVKDMLGIEHVYAAESKKFI
ncbi:hypothetical protein ACP275_04G152200 [Erythranthe tilingii]